MFTLTPPVPPALAPVLTLPARAVILAHLGYTVPVLRTQSQANNCHETCLAALLGVDPATLPRMGGRTMGDSPETVAFLRSLGVGLCYCPIRAAVHPAALSLGALQQRHAALRPFQIVLLYGLHPSGERHVVLARLGPEGRVVRLSDPHPDRAGLVVVHGVGWLWPLAHTTGNNGFPLTLFFNGPPWEDPCADLPVDSQRPRGYTGCMPNATDTCDAIPLTCTRLRVPAAAWAVNGLCRRATRPRSWCSERVGEVAHPVQRFDQPKQPPIDWRGRARAERAERDRVQAMALLRTLRGEE